MVHQQSPEPRPNRLPSFIEVLDRKTKPPVDLFSFYIYMRDQQRSVDYLDFWYVMLLIVTVLSLMNVVKARCLPAHPSVPPFRQRAASIDPG